ncbi:hypothetical protein SAMN05192556_101634 [Halomonas caseinilytica]|uniref:Uncharacterized protein n=1 Tax=Halomonas caseinilytica TaxID=438744 RepID=A0A1M6P6C8_9GAMM|nr:hypothetical protein SAMN04487952_102179 [Halomonas caseinilytica]SHK03460.1 hypothetical protein SAMN05192556_101634 [Halomonas caseinilytica]
MSRIGDVRGDVERRSSGLASGLGDQYSGRGAYRRDGFMTKDCDTP